MATQDLDHSDSLLVDEMRRRSSGTRRLVRPSRRCRLHLLLQTHSFVARRRGRHPDGVPRTVAWAGEGGGVRRLGPALAVRHCSQRVPVSRQVSPPADQGVAPGAARGGGIRRRRHGRSRRTTRGQRAPDGRRPRSHRRPARTRARRVRARGVGRGELRGGRRGTRRSDRHDPLPTVSRSTTVVSRRRRRVPLTRLPATPTMPCNTGRTCHER